jgi:hypothetical protein
MNRNWLLAIVGMKICETGFVIGVWRLGFQKWESAIANRDRRIDNPKTRFANHHSPNR